MVAAKAGADNPLPGPVVTGRATLFAANGEPDSGFSPVPGDSGRVRQRTLEQIQFSRLLTKNQQPLTNVTTRQATGQGRGAPQC